MTDRVAVRGWTQAQFGGRLSEDQAWEQFHTRHPALADYLSTFANADQKRQDKGQYWWELRPNDYYEAFERPKIFWPDIAKLPRYSWDDEGKLINNKGYIIPDADPALLGILQSRVLWFAVSQICQPLRLRASLWQYQMFTQFISCLPIPGLSSAEEDAIGTLAMEITYLARARYGLHRKARHCTLSDLGIHDNIEHRTFVARLQ